MTLAEAVVSAPLSLCYRQEYPQGQKIACLLCCESRKLACLL